MISGGIFGGGEGPAAPAPAATPPAHTPPPPAQPPAPVPDLASGAGGKDYTFNNIPDFFKYINDPKLQNDMAVAGAKAYIANLTKASQDPSTLSQILPHISSWVQGLDGLLGKFASWDLGDYAMEIQDRKDRRIYDATVKQIEYRESLDAKLVPYLQQQEDNRTRLAGEKLVSDERTTLALADKKYAHLDRQRATDDLERKFGGSSRDHFYGSPFARD